MNIPEMRTLAEAVMDARYGASVHDLNERFFRRVDTAITAFSLLGGAGVIVGLALNGSPLSTAGGVLVTVLSVVQALVKPGELAVRHAEARRKYAALDAAGWTMTLAGFDAVLKPLQAESPRGLSSFDAVAYNNNLRSNGYADQIAVRWIGRALNGLV